MDTITGPFGPLKTITWCDKGEHRLRKGSAWFLVLGTSLAATDVACSEHRP